MIDDNALKCVIGVDLGGTKIELGIVDEQGCIHNRQRLETHVSEGANAVERQIVESIRNLQKQAGAPI